MGVSIAEAARSLGTSEQFVRIGLQTGRLPFGSAVKMSSRWTYHISPELFWQYAGGNEKAACGNRRHCGGNTAAERTAL